MYNFFRRANPILGAIIFTGAYIVILLIFRVLLFFFFHFTVVFVVFCFFNILNFALILKNKKGNCDLNRRKNQTSKILKCYWKVLITSDLTSGMVLWLICSRGPICPFCRHAGGPADPCLLCRRGNLSPAGSHGPWRRPGCLPAASQLQGAGQGLSVNSQDAFKSLSRRHRDHLLHLPPLALGFQRNILALNFREPGSARSKYNCVIKQICLSSVSKLHFRCKG